MNLAQNTEEWKIEGEVYIRNWTEWATDEGYFWRKLAKRTDKLQTRKRESKNKGKEWINKNAERQQMRVIDIKSSRIMPSLSTVI